MEAAIAAEHVVDDQKNQIGIEDKQGRTAQRFADDQIEVGRDHQIADEFAVLLDANRTDGDLRIAMHVIEEANTQIAGETLVDQFESGHAPANDAFLGAQVVVANAAAFVGTLFGFVGFAGDPLE